jgi:hypothetical protein
MIPDEALKAAAEDYKPSGRTVRFWGPLAYPRPTPPRTGLRARAVTERGGE